MLPLKCFLFPIVSAGNKHRSSIFGGFSIVRPLINTLSVLSFLNRKCWRNLCFLKTTSDISLDSQISLLPRGFSLLSFQFLCTFSILHWLFLYFFFSSRIPSLGYTFPFIFILYFLLLPNAVSRFVLFFFLVVKMMGKLVN